MDAQNIINWEGRPKRERKPPPKTYWEEYVATDTWYQKELIADIPPDELMAALEDEDFEMDEGGEEGDESESEEDSSEDPDYSESNEEEESDGSDISSEGSTDSDCTVSTASDELSTPPLHTHRSRYSEDTITSTARSTTSASQEATEGDC